MRTRKPFTQIPPGRQNRAFVDGWQTPWVLSNALRLLQPITYQHLSSAVVWVNLEYALAECVHKQIKDHFDPHHCIGFGGQLDER